MGSGGTPDDGVGADLSLLCDFEECARGADEAAVGARDGEAEQHEDKGNPDDDGRGRLEDEGREGFVFHPGEP